MPVFKMSFSSVEVKQKKEQQAHTCIHTNLIAPIKNCGKMDSEMLAHRQTPNERQGKHTVKSLGMFLNNKNKVFVNNFE